MATDHVDTAEVLEGTPIAGRSRRFMKGVRDGRLFASLVAFYTLVSVPDIRKGVDAIVIYPGQGEEWRILKAIKDWRAHGAPAERPWLLLCGSTQTEDFYPHLTKVKLGKLFDMSPEELHWVRVQEHAWQTLEQAEWVYDRICELDIKSVALYTGPYHLFRAYLTLLARLLRSPETVETYLIPAPVSVAPGRIVPESAVPGWLLAPAEIFRIRRYRRLRETTPGSGVFVRDVVDYATFLHYTDWLWANYPPLVAEEEETQAFMLEHFPANVNVTPI